MAGIGDLFNPAYDAGLVASTVKNWGNGLSSIFGGGGGKVSTTAAKPKTKKANGATDNSYVDPLQAAYDFASQFGSSSGGSGGGGGGGGLDISGALGDAANRYGSQKSQIGQLYDQYAASLKPLAGQDKAAYQTAITNAANGSKDTAAQVSGNQANEAQTRANGLASLGVTGAAAQPTETEAATNKGLTDLANNNATWGNMESVLSAAQQNNDTLDYTGAQEAGIEAQKSLNDAYNDYVAQLQQQAAAYSSGGGSGGSSSSYSNPMLDMLNKGIMTNLIQQGLGTGQYSPGKAQFTPTKKQVSSTQNALSKIIGAGNPSPSKAQLSAALTATQLKTYNWLNQ